MWVDSHCHLQLARPDPALLLDRAAGVDWVVAPGIDADTSRMSALLHQTFGDRVLATSGVHPHHSANWLDQRDEIERLAEGASAVGETGLDFYRDLVRRDVQMEALVWQLELAKQLDKAVIVHCRDAFEAVFDTLQTHGASDRTVLHCWTGGPRWSRRFLDLGVTFSFAGPVTFDTGDTVRRGAAIIPPERTMVETDTPYLTPPPRRREPNEPANVVRVGQALAEVWGLEASEVAALTTARAERVFRP